IIRSADLISFDIGAIRYSEASANNNASPNGLFGNTACQLARYAGMSDKCSSFGIYEYNPHLDPNKQSAMLLAQMVWCFIDGYYQRKKDAPLIPKSDYITYKTQLESEENELIFIKSKKSDRWWMQVPYQGFKSLNERYYLVPCSYAEYELAVSGEMPDLWCRTHQKLIYNQLKNMELFLLVILILLLLVMSFLFINKLFYVPKSKLEKLDNHYRHQEIEKARLQEKNDSLENLYLQAQQKAKEEHEKRYSLEREKERL